MNKLQFIGLLLAVLGSAFCFAATPTRTLPIVYVNTQNGQGIYDTETQIPAKVYIDSVNTKYPSLGSASAPIEAMIKGRGNWTWNGFDKKPYKIKFTEKTKVLGMPNNRHWCLQAGADDWLGFMRNPLGHKLSKAMGLRWTPRMRPVELVLNGEYKGFYFLTEHVRIASHRVHIKEQAEGETHPDSITGGWLVEIDNYQSDNNIAFEEGNGQWVMISLREPKELSSAQRSYLEQQIYAINDVLYGSSSAELERILDINEAAKYYLVQEIMEDCESYHGSCFLYKDRDSLGVADKWKFGPVWDFGNAYNRHEETWIYVNPTWPQYWIGQLAEWPVFQNAVQEQWWLFYHNQKDSVRADILELASQIEKAAIRDADVWRGTQNYCDNSNFADVRDRLLRRYDWRINWLYSQWGEGIQPKVEGIEDVQRNDVQGTKILRNGQLLILRGGKTYNFQGQQTH
ncbi:MAG: CotH kinase family protein [Paludibacteraceae bacterium]|nr:CotH kinase family protein [Paludibacteraceae bacterium]